MHENQGPITVTFKHAPGDVVLTYLEDKGVVESCVHERGGNYYTVNLTGGNRSYLYEDEVYVFIDTPE